MAQIAAAMPDSQPCQLSANEISWVLLWAYFFFRHYRVKPGNDEQETFLHDRV